MLRSSERFVFDTPGRIQFVAGMYRQRDHLVVSYGVGDVASMETHVPIAQALALLRRSGTATATATAVPAATAAAVAAAAAGRGGGPRQPPLVLRRGVGN
jgi:hypothetical protein